MGKETGLGANFYLDGYDLSGDTGSLEKISKAMTPIPQTGINKLAVERNAGQLMAGIDWTSFFNPTNAHPPLSLLPRTDRIATYFHQELLRTPTASMVCKQLDYAGTRAADGALLALLPQDDDVLPHVRAGGHRFSRIKATDFVRGPNMLAADAKIAAAIRQPTHIRFHNAPVKP